MSLSLLHGGIAVLGVAAASIPVILHLLLKQRPRPLVFPALQLVRSRRRSTVRRLRLQHLILLLMRIGLLVLLALALARPTLHSPLFSIDQEAPVAAVLIFDNSLSMEYEHRGKTRLQEAKELAERVVHELPEGSKITVLESANPVRSVGLDIPGGLAQIETISSDATPRPLNDAIAIALESLAKSTYDRREVYVFSDLAANSWDLTASEQLQQLIDRIDTGVRIYVINVGIEQPENISLGELQLSRQILPADGSLTIGLTVHNAGPAADRAVELFVGSEPRDSQPVRLPNDQATELSLSVPGLVEGVHQGRVSIATGDALPFDDVRHFTVEVRSAVKTLVVTSDPRDAINWVNALVPRQERQHQRGQYAIDTIDERKLPTADLASYSVVALLNVGTVPEHAWAKLFELVQRGGGLFVALGERIDSISYNTDAAQSVLPATLDREERSREGVSLAPDRFTHPVLSRLRPWQAEVESELANQPVFVYWKVKTDERRPLTVVPFSNGDPALLERSFGAGHGGRCLLLTTAAHYRPSLDSWSELPLSWVYVALADHVTLYLAGVAETTLNYLAGQNVSIGLDPTDPVGLFLVTDPEGRVERTVVEPREGALTIPTVKVLGNYQVSAGEPGHRFVRGFSVCAPAEESVLTPLQPEQLADLIGKDHCSIARDPDSLGEVIGEARVGRELFAWIMLLVVALVCAEGYFANRFYRQPSTAE